MTSVTAIENLARIIDRGSKMIYKEHAGKILCEGSQDGDVDSTTQLSPRCEDEAPAEAFPRNPKLGLWGSMVLIVDC